MLPFEKFYVYLDAAFDETFPLAVATLKKLEVLVSKDNDIYG